jgi:hypothetical protein
MKTRLSIGATMLAALVGTAYGAGGDGCGQAGCADASASVPDALVHPDELARRQIARHMLPMLPQADRDAIIAAGGIGSEGMHAAACAPAGPDTTPREYMERVFSDELRARMDETQWRIVNGIIATLERGDQAPAVCFHPDADNEYVHAINQLLAFSNGPRFQQGNRWNRTAISGSGLQRGQPTVLTYSFVPDGTFVPNLIGATGNSNLRAWLNGIYGSQANWQPLFEQVFDRWSELIGTTYVYEPNDDGSQLNSGAGIVGVRGDVRIAAIAIDGGGGTLAYNNFPQDGDMVFDSADGFYNNTASNSLRFRNVAAHEHGHGLGMYHVCPTNQTKLMEPFASTAFNGPQLDDILNGHRFYGDPLEPATDSPDTAPSLGTFGVGGNAIQSNVSIDGTSDQDFYRVTLTEPAQIQVTVSPDAGSYLQGPQTGACNTGVLTDYNAVRDLRIDVYSPINPFAPLATADTTGLGGTEVLAFNAIDPGEYLVRVSASGPDNVQRYVLGALVAPLPFLEPLIEGDVPLEVDPGETTSFTVTVEPRDDDLVGTPQLFYRANPGESFVATDLAILGGSTYEVTLPGADCDDAPQFYLSVVGQQSGEVTLPAAGASGPFDVVVGSVVSTFEDNFESDTGWTVTGAASGRPAGRWERGVPNGNGSRGDAPTDFDGSGQCFLTGNGGPNSNTDVDAGETILTSPALDALSVGDAHVSYARWYDNTGSGQGAAPGTDTFKVQISNDNGASWVALETVGPNTAQSSGGWFEVSFRVADFVTPTEQVRVRFIADDLGEGSVVEAAVDAFGLRGVVCEDVIDPGCSPADLAEPFGVLNFFDLSAYLNTYNAGDPAADLAAPFGTLNFFDLSAYLSVYNQGCQAP